MQIVCGGTQEQASDSQCRVAKQHCFQASTSSIDHTGYLVASVETVNGIPSCFACSRTCGFAPMKAQCVGCLRRNFWSCRQTNQVSEFVLSGVSRSSLCSNCSQKGNLSVRKTCPLSCKWYQCLHNTPSLSLRGLLCLHLRVHSLVICVCAQTVLFLPWTDGLFTFMPLTEPVSARPHLLLEASITGYAHH